MNELIIAEHKTFDLTICDYMDGAVVTTSYRSLSITRYTDGSVLCECDGNVISEEEAISFGQRAQLDGQIVETSHVNNRVGNKPAYELHKELGRLGYRNHHQVASEVLGRTVTSLAALVADELALTKEYAYGQLGLVAA